ncbi:MAG TPA: undecaprenyl-phosphate galactose phosphotransferase WbaP [Azospirillaceae bacterium]|nr:undecaprenyl-phosphate galactose phosphotransferase WbaP [Azospirillaceae bacterium]
MVSHVGYAAERERTVRAGRLTSPAPVLALGDVAACLLAFLVSSVLVFAAIAWVEAGRLPARLDTLILERFKPFVVFIPFLVFWFGTQGHYKRGLPFWTEARQIAGAVLMLALIDGFSQYVSQELYSRPWLVLNWVLAGLFLFGGRIALKAVMLRIGVWQMPTVVVGTARTIAEAVAALGSERLLGYQVVQRVDIEGPNGVVPTVDELTPFHAPHFVVIAADAANLPRVEPLIGELHRRGKPFAIVPPLSGISVLNMKAQGFFSHDAVLLTAPNNLASTHARMIKRTFDLVVAGLLVVLLSPVFLLLAYLIRRDGGPAFYSQKRIGRGGRLINCLKFRSMVPNAEAALQELLDRDPAARAEWDATLKLKNDPRITPVGHFLRRTSLDELPQLFNVLRGEMSLVGPRPMLLEEPPKFGADIVYYYEVDPGITGLWQVSGRNDVDYKRRVQLNSWYVRNWSLWYDITILLKTVRVVLTRDGAY